MRSKDIDDNRHRHQPKTAEEKYTIHEIAELTGTNGQTIRYYTKIGLLSPVEKTAAGYRLYTMEEIWRLRLILTLRYLNFSIDEIRKVLSGRLPIKAAIKWQIEALDIQMRTMSNMKSILQQTISSDGETGSLDYMHELVESISAGTAEREKFFFEKMYASIVPEGFPAEWTQNFLLGVTDSIFTDGKMSATQLAALSELEELLNDPQFVKEMKRNFLSYMSIVSQPRVDARTWGRNMRDIHKRLVEVWERQVSPGDPLLQAIIHDYMQMFATEEQIPITPAFVRQYAENSRYNQTERIDRFKKLWAILNPELGALLKANILFYQGMQWKLDHLDD